MVLEMTNEQREAVAELLSRDGSYGLVYPTVDDAFALIRDIVLEAAAQECERLRFRSSDTTGYNQGLTDGALYIRGMKTSPYPAEVVAQLRQAADEELQRSWRWMGYLTVDQFVVPLDKPGDTVVPRLPDRLRSLSPDKPKP